MIFARLCKLSHARGLALFTNLYSTPTDSLQDSPQAHRMLLVPSMCAAIKLAEREWGIAGMVNQGKILYVDDNPKSRRRLRSVIRSWGFEVVSAGPHEALSRIRKSSFDLALLDYPMPDVTGSQLAQGIKSTKPDVAVVLISGFSVLPPLELIFADAHVGRGATLDELLDTMRTLIHSRCNFIAPDFIRPPNTSSAAECGPPHR